MSPDSYFTPLKGQSLLIPGQNENVRGQCVQSAGLWIMQQGLKLPAYTYAYMYWDNGVSGMDKIPAGQPIRQGDTVIWGKNFPSSPGAGHIDTASADGTLQDFWAWDSNWGSPSLKLNKIHHTGTANNYIVGYLRKKGVGMPNESEVKSAFAQYNIVGSDGVFGVPSASQVTYYTTHTWDVLLNDLLQFVWVNYTVDANAVDLGFQLGFARPATADEKAYWPHRSPSEFLGAVENTKITGPTNYIPVTDKLFKQKG